MANYFYKGKEVRSRSDRDLDVKLSLAHTVTLKHTDINFRVTDSVATDQEFLSQYNLQNAKITPKFPHFMKVKNTSGQVKFVITSKSSVKAC